jgi:hypothetical protein
MVIADIFRGLDIDDAPDFPILDDLPDRSVKRRVSQHMAYHHQTLAAFGRLQKLQRFFLGNADRLFQQNMIARFQQRQRGLDMDRIHRPIDCGIRQPGSCDQLLHRFEAHVVHKLILVRHELPANGIGIDYRDDAQLLRMFLRIGGVYETAMPGAYDHRGYGTIGRNETF